MNFDWSDLAFASKQPIRDLNATFIAAPRELSSTRLKQLVKQHLSSGNIIFGISRDPYVSGLEGQDAFAMLTEAQLAPLAQRISDSGSPHQLVTLTYFQRELPYILDKINFKKVIFINGSWFHAFHQHPFFYTLHKRHIPYERLSPFASEAEAKQYDAAHPPRVPNIPDRVLSAREMLQAAKAVAKNSFDFGGYQIGVALGRAETKGYRLVTTSFNKVVPYQTYAMHFGASREDHFAPLHDLNHYDTNHAEIELIIKAAKKNLDLSDTTLFINVLPCPACARMFTSTDIAHFVYSEDHTDGYAVKMLEAAGKSVKRLIG